MRKTLFLFDVDGTLAESGQNISCLMEQKLHDLVKRGIDIGIVGGGKLDKILQQMGTNIYFHHYFSECGCVYNRNISSRPLHLLPALPSIHAIQNEKVELEEIYKKDIRKHILYPNINIIIKEALLFLSQVEYTLTGNFVDLRNGIIYISLIGMTANQEERKYFLDLDNKNHYKAKLLTVLHQKAYELNILPLIDIVEGGSVGIAIYPKEYDKIQVVEHVVSEYNEIHYFGDKYNENGNDYKIINHPDIIGYCVDNPNDTMKSIDTFLERAGAIVL